MRALTRGEKHHGGRNATGRITCRHRGGAAHRKKLRLVDFERRAAAPGVVERLEYDPGRTGYIALVKYPEGGWVCGVAVSVWGRGGCGSVGGCECECERCVGCAAKGIRWLSHGENIPAGA
jgi:ribosomal protein L2